MQHTKHNFRNGDYVVVRRLGDSMPGDHPAIIRGVYGHNSLVNSYIVEWKDNSEIYGGWDCSVMIETCIDLV